MIFTQKVIMLTVSQLIWIIVFFIYTVAVVRNVIPMMSTAANNSDIGGQVIPIYNNIVIYGYIGIILYGIGNLIYLMISAFKDEGEVYRTYDERMNNEYNR